MKKSIIGTLGLAFCVSGLVQGGEMNTGTNGANYARPFESATRPALIPLPPGAVEPQGWLRDWCLAAKDGFTGHMDEYDVEFKRAWAADHKPNGERLLWNNGGWPLEGGGYWFDGLARLGFALHDEVLIAQAKRRLDAVADNMNTNGLLFLWWLDRNKPEDRKAVTAALDGWPLWASGLLGRAMTGFYAGSGDKRILGALEKAYGSDPDGLRSITGSLSNPWPAYDTYAWTGNPGIKAALDAVFKEGNAALLPNVYRYRQAPSLKPGTTVDNAHVVEFLESTTPWAVAYLWTGDVRYLQAAVGWHDLLERVAMQPHGVPVADEWYGPTGAFRGSETCDVAGYIWSQICLLSVTGDGRMADRAERAFFNAGPATVSRDFKTHVYFQSPNRFANLSPDYPHGPRAGGGVYKTKHNPLCCTAALNRIVPGYVTHMWMATYDNGLAATCYGPCKVTALAANRVPVVITCQTDYPFNETIEMSVQPAREAAFPIDFHIPGWCAAPRLSVNGSDVAVERTARGFTRVDRTWKPGDTVKLHFPMTAKVQTGRDVSMDTRVETAHRATPVTVPEENSQRGAPYASVSYGPLLFALPIPDTADANTPDPVARWKFALDIQEPRLTVERSAMPARWDWPLASPLKLKVNACETAWNPDPKTPKLPAAPVAGQKAAEAVTLVPYGCTKFRISMFPVTAAPEVKPAAPEVKPAAIRKILFLGNSITLHGPYVAWSRVGGCGMAASDPEKDYVHLLASAIATHTGTSLRIAPTPCDLPRWYYGNPPLALGDANVLNIADLFERNYATWENSRIQRQIDGKPDIVVLQFGENMVPGDMEKFKVALETLMTGLKTSSNPRIFVTSFILGSNPAIDKIKRQVCDEDPSRRVFVDLAAAHVDTSGAAGHPGDAGMKTIADTIWKAVQELK